MILLLFVYETVRIRDKLFVYYKEIKQDLKRRPIHGYRCDERLKVKTEGSTRLTHTVLCGGLEHLKIETRLIDESLVSVMGECASRQKWKSLLVC
jgi:hypothetical protein